MESIESNGDDDEEDDVNIRMVNLVNLVKLVISSLQYIGSVSSSKLVFRYKSINVYTLKTSKLY